MKVYVHGGVSGLHKGDLPSLSYAVEAGRDRSSSLDAAEAAVVALEDDPALNAGFGSVLTRDGILEMDAGFADGSTGRYGGVAAVRLRHPVSLARRVAERTPHCLLTGPGAMDLASGLEPMERSSEEQHERWEEAHASGALDLDSYGTPEHVDTVGAVVVDERGFLAAASSTGGVFGKMAGRVGDAPIFGAGIYASKTVAVVGTGVGEVFLETLAARRVAELVESGRDPQSACARVIVWVGERSDAAVGLLAVDVDGRFGSAYRGGSWAVAGPDGMLEPELIT